MLSLLWEVFTRSTKQAVPYSGQDNVSAGGLAKLILSSAFLLFSFNIKNMEGN